MDRITYTVLDASQAAVFLAGKRVGTIHKHANGFQYVPKGQKDGGQIFPTVARCKQSLEEN